MIYLIFMNSISECKCLEFAIQLNLWSYQNFLKLLCPQIDVVYQ